MSDTTLSASVRKYSTEFIGTFFLVFTVVCCVTTQAELAPIGIGAILMTQIYAGGHISGAHYNPAVSIAAFIRGRLALVDLGAYVATQLVAGAAAAGLGLWIFGSHELGGEGLSGKNLAVVLVVEALFTFALAYTVLNVATSKDNDGNSFYGLAIGFTVAAGAIAVAKITGAVFNPAVALGISIADLSHWSNLWIYFVAQVIGGLVAGLVFKLNNPTDA